VKVGGTTKADFDYDADGVRVRSAANGETTIYAGAGYEVVVAGGQPAPSAARGRRRCRR
jgi:hypothetical protein